MLTEQKGSRIAKISVLIIACVVVVLSFLYWVGSRELEREEGREIIGNDGAKKGSFIGDAHIEIEFAMTAAAKAKGLGGRNPINASEGMLFVYDVPGYYSFWMKDMRFPIDILWLNSEMRVIDITENVSPDTFPQVFTSRLPAQYVLEVVAGFVEQNNIKTESPLAISY